jgi:hypothetical protein
MRRTARLLALLALLLAVVGVVQADDAKTKKDKAKDKETQDSPIEAPDVRQGLEKVSQKVKDGSWTDALAAGRDLIDAHPDALLLVDDSVTLDDHDHDPRRVHLLHLPVGSIVRRQLAVIPAEGCAALRTAYGDEAARRLDAAWTARDASALVEVGDVYFPLAEGAEALLASGDLQLERGCLAGAAQVWRDVLELHPDGAEREKAARRLLALVPLLSDPATANDLAIVLDQETKRPDAFTAAADLEDAAAEAGVRLADQLPDDVAMDGSGALAPVYSAVAPGVVAKRIHLPSEDVKGIDWRTEETAPNQFGQQMPIMRRLLSGHLATDDMLLVHLGKVIEAYYTHDDDSYEPAVKEGDEAWVFGKPGWVKGYLEGLIASSAIPRFGIAVLGSRVYATLAASPREDDDEPTTLPQGRLVCLDIETGRGGGRNKAFWDTSEATTPAEAEDESPRKRHKKDQAPEEKKLKLSFIGTPLVGGERIYCPAANAREPHETWVVALDRRDGRIIWKRLLASSTPFPQQNNGWEASFPRAMPTPSLTLAEGALVALSNNGVLEAFDAVDGRILWARTYAREDDKAGNRQPWRRDPSEIQKALSRGYNAPLPLGDAVLVLPTDSQHMTIARISDGVQLSQPKGREKIDHVLGIFRGRVVLEGKEGVSFYAIKRQRSVRLDVDVTGTFTATDAKRYGRGVICRDGVYVPTQRRLVCFRVKDGKGRTVMEWNKPKQELGDLVVGGGRIFSIGAANAHTYKEDE